MRLVFICKRSPQQRDLLTRPYGRFHYLPAHLAQAGHEVKVFLISHRGLDSSRSIVDGIEYSCLDLRRLGPFEVLRSIGTESAPFRPDWVVGFSDTYLGWLAACVARKTVARLAVDAYDNYESYMPWNLPLRYFWRRTVEQADLVTAAGPELAELLQESRSGKSPVQIVPMSADPSFVPMDLAECRTQFGLPIGSPLIGYFGGWGESRGTEVLIDAFAKLRLHVPDAMLVLSGRPPADVTSLPGVRALGYVEDNEIPVLTNAVDVACVICADTAFGRFSYPSKLCEAIACGTTVVGSSTGPISWMLDHDPRYLVRLGDSAELARKIEDALAAGRPDYPDRKTWAEVALLYGNMLSDNLSERPSAV